MTGDRPPRPLRTAGILHPGQMGSSVGAALREGGLTVLWASTGRSEATRARATADALEDVGTIEALAGTSDLLLSVCPPEAALAVAREIAQTDFHGLYVDANAVSPATARSIGDVVEPNGAHYVDGGIIGPPAREGRSPRLYLSGDRAEEVAALFEDTAVTAVSLGSAQAAASALKVAYAGWTKGTTALLTAILALAEHEQIIEPLLAEWERMGLVNRANGLGGAAAKAWRWTGEMQEIAASFAAAGLPDGFHQAAAEVYSRLSRFKDDPNAPGGTELARWLLP